MASIPLHNPRFFAEYASLKTVLETQPFEEASIHFTRLNSQTQTVILQQLTNMFPPQANSNPYMPPLDLETFSSFQIRKLFRVKTLEELPIDHLTSILLELSIDDLLSVEQVSKFFKSLYNTSRIWRALSQKAQVPLNSKEDYFNLVRHTRIVEMLGKGLYTLNASHVSDNSSIHSGFQITNRVEVWDLVKNEHLINLNEPIDFSCLKKTENFFFSGSIDGVIRGWNLTAHQYIVVLRKDNAKITCLEKAENEGVLLAGSANGTITRWDLKTQQEISSFQAHQDSITGLVKEENILYSASLDKTIKVWDLDTQECTYIFEEHSAGINCLLKNGHFLFSASNDGSIKKWSLIEKKCVHTFAEHAQPVFHLLIDNHLLFSVSSSCTKVWDLITHQCVLNLNIPKEVAALQKQGDFLYIGYSDGTIIARGFKPFPYSELLKAAKLIRNYKKKEGIGIFLSFRFKCTNAVYEEFYKINSFEKYGHELACATNCFLDQNGDFSVTNKRRARAIHCFVLKEIVSCFEFGSKRRAMAILNKLPSHLGKKIHKEVSHLTDLPITSLQIDNNLWIEAINNYLKVYIKKTSKIGIQMT